MYTPESFATIAQDKTAFVNVALANHGTGSWRAYATRSRQTYADGNPITDPDDMTSEDIVTARRPARPKEWKSIDTARAWLRENGYTGAITISD